MSSFCLGCGNSLAAGERFCGSCGRDALAAADAPRVDPAVAFGLMPETSGKAIFSLVCGAIFLILPFSFVAVIWGYLALSEIRKSPGRLTGKGMAIAGIALGYIGVALTVFLIGLRIYEQHHARTAVTTHPTTAKRQRTLSKPRIVSDANPVVSAVRTLNTAEIAYGQAHKSLGYTCSLSDLKGSWGIGNLSQGQTDGYIFELKDCKASNGIGPVVMYRLVAYPATKKPGAPAYCSDESDVIRISRNGSANDCLKTGTDLAESEINKSPPVSQSTR
jgi:hypothetical protein